MDLEQDMAIHLMKPRRAECDSTTNVALYWSTKNLINKRMKTYYCKHCAGRIVPGQEAVK